LKIEDLWSRCAPSFLNTEEDGFGCQVSGVGCRVSARPSARKTTGQIERVTEFVQEDKLQMTNTKLQTNIKSQYPMTETHFAHGKGYRDLGSTIR